MPLSRSPYLGLTAFVLATIPLGFGLNGIWRPRLALAFFEFELPATKEGRRLADTLITLYAARDVFMGLAIYAAALLGASKTLGCILVAASGVAVVDGIVTRSQIGRGEWNHWGFAPVPALLGLVLLGVLDRPSPKRS